MKSRIVGNRDCTVKNKRTPKRIKVSNVDKDRYKEKKMLKSHAHSVEEKEDARLNISSHDKSNLMNIQEDYTALGYKTKSQLT